MPPFRSPLLPVALLLLLVPAACNSGGNAGPQSQGRTIQNGAATVTVPLTFGIPSDGIAGAPVQVTLRDPNGQPLAARQVSLTATGSENSFFPAATVTTGLDGRAEIRLTSTRAERKQLTVTADLQGAAEPIATGIEVQFGQPQVARARVSVSSSGTEGNDFSEHAAVSGDGRWIAFMSKADNLVPGDTNQKEDVFLHDRRNGNTSRISLLPDGSQFPDLCGKPALDDTGSFVVFMGRRGDTDAIWLRDRLANLTTAITEGAGFPGRCMDPVISGDGRWIAFVQQTGEQQQVWLHDRVLGGFVIVSRSSQGQAGNGPSHAPSISRNGRWIAFASEADNLVSGDSNEKLDVFVHDRQTGSTRLVSRNQNGNLGDEDSVEAAIAADGRFVAFASKAANLVPQDDNGKSDVFVVDLQNGNIERISVDPRGQEVDQESWLPRLSANGNFVVWSSLADDLVVDDGNGKEDIFGRDRASGTTHRLSLALGSTDPNEYCTAPAVAADAPVVVFTAKADNLVRSDENDQPDVFVAPRR